MMTEAAFRAAVARAAARAQRERDERDTCPKEDGGCGKRGTLCSVARRGATLGKLCPICGWSSFEMPSLPKKRAMAAKKRGKK